MAFLARVAPRTRTGKILWLCAIGSGCTALLLSPVFSPQHRPWQTARDDADLSSNLALAHDGDAVRAERSAPAAASAPPAAAAASSVAMADTHEVVVRSTVVRTSFADAAQRLGLDANTVALLTRSYAADLDFRRDLRHGDTISLVLAEPHVGESGGAPAGPPLAVRIQQGAKSHDLFLHRSLEGKPFYYKYSGAAASPSFARYPLAYERISSGFAHRRLDPVTHRWQSHDGVDLAAPAGTPVHATARGTVAFIGRQTGYGRIVVLNNAPPYQTAFAHLSRFAKGLHRGSRVRRGQVIGYVGSTGWATGPHLHFEVRVNHVPMNPLTVALPGDPPLRGNERTQFAEQANYLAALL